MVHLQCWLVDLGFLHSRRRKFRTYQSFTIFYRYALAAKTLPPTLKEVLGTCVKAINWIRGRGVNHSIFKLLCNDLKKQNTVLLFHTVSSREVEL